MFNFFDVVVLFSSVVVQIDQFLDELVGFVDVLVWVIDIFLQDVVQEMLDDVKDSVEVDVDLWGDDEVVSGDFNVELFQFLLKVLCSMVIWFVIGLVFVFGVFFEYRLLFRCFSCVQSVCECVMRVDRIWGGVLFFGYRLLVV